MEIQAGTRLIRLLAVIEATRYTGPARNLVEFGRRAREGARFANGAARLETCVATYVRQRNARAIGDSQFCKDPAVSGLRSESEFVAAARHMGISVELIGERFRMDPAAVQQLRRIIVQRSPDIIQTHNVKSHFLMRLSGLRRRPWVAFHHGYTATDLKDRLYNQLNRWSLPAADRVIAVSHAFSRQLASEGVRPARIRVVHNAIDPDRFETVSPAEVEAVRARLNLSPGEHLVLSIGRLSFEKGHVDLVEAVRRLKEMHPQLRVRLLILGDGPERDRIQRMAERLGIPDRIALQGYVHDPSPYLVASSALALSSYSEGSPNVLLEAMIARLPVVATSVGGIPEIVTDRESALLVPPHDGAAMAAALQQILTHRELAASLARRARERAIQRHSPEARLQQLLCVYEELIRQPSGING